jgi:hypothetical protein
LASDSGFWKTIYPVNLDKKGKIDTNSIIFDLKNDAVLIEID